MKRLEISSEQTLRLEELRSLLAKALPANRGEAICFPVQQYGGCGAVCMPGCTGNCTGNCAGRCTGGCTLTCFITCKNMIT